MNQLDEEHDPLQSGVNGTNPEIMKQLREKILEISDLSMKMDEL